MDAAEMRTTWRAYVNETDTTVVPDATVDRFMRGGLVRTNRRIGYYFKDSTVNLVAGTQEYALPTDFVHEVFLYWNTLQLKKADVERWIADNENWQEMTGAPAEYAIYGSKLILLPIPDARSVTADSTLTVRHVATPPDFAANGPAGLMEQDHELPILAAVALWSESNPNDALATLRATAFTDQFERECAAVEQIYEERRLLRWQPRRNQ